MGLDFPEILKSAFDSYIAGSIHTALPGQVETYDYQLQKASVKPLLKKHYLDGEELSLPVIVNVPVIFPRSGGASLTFPVNKGDYVLIIFIERALENWLSLGGEVAPGDRRKFDLSDAIAIPGLYPFTDVGPAENNADVLLKFNAAKFRIDSTGKFALGNASAELLDLLDQLLAALISSVTATAIGPQQLSVSIDGTLSQIQSKLDQIKGSI